MFTLFKFWNPLDPVAALFHIHTRDFVFASALAQMETVMFPIQKHEIS
jgi:hypothetical protein